MGATCLASDFSVPFSLNYDFHNEVYETKTILMKNPASVGLQTCEVQRMPYVDSVFIQNLKGDALFCSVSLPVVKPCDWIFSVENPSRKEIGDVWFISDELGMRLEVERKNEGTKGIQKLDAFKPWKTLQRRQYDIGKDSLTLRKFFGYDEAGYSMFVSATIAYNDLKHVVISYGKGGRDWVTDVMSIGILNVNPEEQMELSVPCTLEYDAHDKVADTKTMFLKNPTSIGLQACEVQRMPYEDRVFVQNLKGDALFCSVSLPVVEHCDWIFSVEAPDKEIGDVWFISDSELGMRLEVEQKNEGTKGTQKLGAFKPWSTLQRRRYDIGKDSLTLRKFFGYDETGCGTFVSATIAYNDLKHVVISYGKGGRDWIKDVASIGVLNVDSEKKVVTT